METRGRLASRSEALGDLVQEHKEASSMACNQSLVRTHDYGRRGAIDDHRALDCRSGRDSIMGEDWRLHETAEFLKIGMPHTRARRLRAPRRRFVEGHLRSIDGSADPCHSPVQDLDRQFRERIGEAPCMLLVGIVRLTGSDR